MITYGDLLKGHILKVGDSLEIDECKYQVDINSGYYLMGLNCDNSTIFRDDHLNNMSERHDWARKFGEMVGSPNCYFPELRTLEQLTKFVIDIYEKVYDKLRGISSPSVSFEVAKLLKEKGFDEPCEGFYVKSKSKSIESKSKSIIISLPKGNKTLTHIKL